MSPPQIASLLTVGAGAFGAITCLFLRLPSAIGLLVVALLASVGIMPLDVVAQGLEVAMPVRTAVLEIEFSDALLEGTLGPLLFARAVHVKLAERIRRIPELPG